MEVVPKSSVEVSEGSDVRFQCRIFGGVPTPELQWRRRDGKPLPESAIVTKNGALKLSKVSGLDQGVYDCEAANAAGKPSDTLLHPIPCALQEHNNLGFFTQKTYQLRSTNSVEEFETRFSE